MFKFNCYLPRLMYKVNKVTYGKNLKLIGWPFIFRYPKAKITIGDGCTINSNFFSNFIGLYQRTILVAREQGEIKIGNNVGISGSTIYVREGVEIGDNVYLYKDQMYEYKVDVIREVDMDNVHISGDLSLVTCVKSDKTRRLLISLRAI